MKKILVVANDPKNIEGVTNFLKSRNVDIHFEKAVNPGIEYAREHKNELAGILLSLELTTFENSDDYDFTNGVKLIRTLGGENVNIPILINSRIKLHLSRLMDNYNFVKGQMYVEDDYQTLGNFINSLD